MSMGQEILDEYAYEMYYLCQAGIWTTKEGKQVHITEMTIPHIQSCMKMVGENTDWYKVFEDELERRNEVLASFSLWGEMI